jgi:hypothetical protein
MHREALLLSPQEPTSSLSPQDFDAIEAAVMETSRGRWFLTEYARRNRHADTEKLLEAIGRLETTVEASGPVRDPGGDLMRFRREIADMAETVSLAKQEIASSVMEDTGERRGPGPQERAYEDLIRTAEKADQDVFNAAEHVQEIAWAMRETGEIGSSCDDLDRHALEIYRASNQHALTTNRVRSIIGVLRFIEARIEALMGAYPSELVLLGNERPDAPHGVSTATLLDSAPPRIRDDIVFVEHGGQQRAPAPERASDVIRPSTADPISREVPLRPLDPRAAPFAAFDALEPEQKLALFA